MNDKSDSRQDVLNVVELQQIELACKQFRTAWEGGQHPRIEDYVAFASANCRSELLRRLVVQELTCRSRSGETAAAEEFERRFPADATTIRLAFSLSTRLPSDQAEDVTRSLQNAALAVTETQLWEGTREQTTGSAEERGSIGRYKVLGVLGRGGFGTVYRARDEELQRDVAIKVWRRDRFAGEEDVERLLQEARHVARLEKHPAIVGVYDVGRQQDGSAFVVLQYIEGHSLEQELKSRKLPPDRVWEIMLQVTAAIQHAHAVGLVHRDLKPANVLLDADGNAHVADFGLAIDDDSQRVRAGEVSGTPAYMAPEQVRGEAHRLDGRADLWALGVMLYEMLTRRRPFRGENRNELFDDILHREPKPPRQLDPEIPPDLERICLKCLSKSVTERYLTAADLAKDLRHAREAPQRRKRHLATIATAATTGLVVLGAVWAYLVVAGNRPVISVRPGSGLQIRHRATLRGHTDAVWSVAFSPDDRTLASAGVDMTIKLWDVPNSREVQQLTGHRGEVRSVAFAPDGQTLASAGSDRSIVLWNRETGEIRHQITGHTGDARSVVYLPNGNQLVSGSVDKTVRFWDSQSGSEQKKVEAHRAAIQNVACSRDGKTLASSSDDRTIVLLAPETGQLLRTLKGHTDGVAQAAFSPDGRQLASASWDKTIRIWDVATGDVLRTIDKQEDAVRSVSFSPDGRRLAFGGDDNTIRLWDPKTGEELATLRGHAGPVTSVAFSSDGRILASASADRTVVMWELEEAEGPKPDDRPIAKQPSRKQGKLAATPSAAPTTKPQTPTVGKPPVPAFEPSPAEWVPLVNSEDDLKTWEKTGSGSVTFDNGAVRVQDAAVTYPTQAADLAIRTQVRNEADAKPNVRLLLRETPAGSYAAVLENGNRLVVGVTEGEKWRELKSVPVNVPVGQPLDLEFSAVGDLLTVFLNGKPAIEVRDSTHRYGSPGLAATDGTTVFQNADVKVMRGKEARMAEAKEKMQPAKPSAAPPSEPTGSGVVNSGDKALDSRRPLPKGQWVPLLTSPVNRSLRSSRESWGPLPEKAIEAGVLRVDADKSVEILYPMEATDVALRVKGKKVRGGALTLLLRSGPDGNYQLNCEDDGAFTVASCTRSGNYQVLGRARFPTRTTDFFELGFSAIGDILSAYVDGRLILQVRDSTYLQGGVTFASWYTTSLFKDAMAYVLRYADDPPAAKTADDSTGKSSWDPLALARPWPPMPVPPAMAPFDPAQARQHQEAWAKHLGIPVEETNSIGMKLLVIPPGDYEMGISTEEVDSLKTDVTATAPSFASYFAFTLPFSVPKHRVRLLYPFQLAACEVTREQFQEFVEDTGYRTTIEGAPVRSSSWRFYPDRVKELRAGLSWRSPVSSSQKPSEPVVNVSFDDAQVFCDWLSRKERVDYRLPTEEEWEFACRAGGVMEYSFVSKASEVPEYAWTDEAQPRPDNRPPERLHAVGTKLPNPFGLFDTLGNVQEWCARSFYPNQSASLEQTAVLRGGESLLPACAGLHVHRVFFGVNAFAGNMQGFRVVREVPAGLEQLPEDAVAAEHWVAKWLLDRGGLMTVRTETQSLPVSGVDELPDEPFSVESVTLGPGARFLSAELAYLQRLTNLSVLKLNNRNLTDRAAARLVGLKGLTELHVDGCPLLSPAGWGYLAKNDSVRRLTAPYNTQPISDQVLAQLTGFTSLEQLDLTSHPITDAGLKHVGTLRGLRVLNLRQTKVGDAGLQHLRDLKQLTDLNLASTQVTDAGLGTLASLENLSRLDLWATKVTGAGLAPLAHLKNLTTLVLAKSKLNDEGCAGLGMLASLQWLSLAETSVSEAGLRHLRGLTNLQELRLTSTSTTDAGVAHLESLKLLTTMELTYTLVSDDGARCLLALPELKWLKLTHSRVTDRTADAARNAPKLEYLCVSGSEVTDKALPSLAALTSIKTLRIMGTRMSPATADELKRRLPACNVEYHERDAEFYAVASMVEVAGSVGKVLSSDGSQLPIASRAELMALTSPVHVLEFSAPGAFQGDAITTKIGRLSAIRLLNLKNARITDRGLETLRNLKTLETLILDANAIDDEGLRNLVELTNLGSLSLKTTRVTPAGVQMLMDKLPKCRVESDWFVTRTGGPLFPQSSVAQPASIPGLRSWAVLPAAHQSSVSAVASSSRGASFAVAGDDGEQFPATVRVWGLATDDTPGFSAESRCAVLLGHDKKIEALAWAPDGTYLASTGQDLTVKLWEPAAGRLLRTFALNSPGYALGWSPSADRLAVACGTAIALIDIKSGEMQEIANSETKGPVAWLPDGKRLLVHSYAGSTATLAVYDAQTLEVDRSIMTEELTGRSASLSPDGRQIAASYGDKLVRLWDVETCERVQELTAEDGEIVHVAWSPTGDRLATVGKSLIVWDAAKGERLTTVKLESGTPLGMSWTADGQHVAVGLPTAVELYSAADGVLFDSLTVSGKLPQAELVISPDGHYRAAPQVEAQLVYVVLTDDYRQETYTPAAFAAKFGWKN